MIVMYELNFVEYRKMTYAKTLWQLCWRILLKNRLFKQRNDIRKETGRSTTLQVMVLWIRFKNHIKQDNGKLATNLWLFNDVGHTDEAKKELKSIFNGMAPIETPKPSSF